MGKAFFDVFGDIKLQKDIQALFREVIVTRVVSTTKKDIIKVYFESNNLILKEDVYTVENELKKQLFRNADVTVKLYEKFLPYFMNQ